MFFREELMSGSGVGEDPGVRGGRDDDASAVDGTSARRRMVGLLLMAVLALGLVRLGLYVAHFWTHSLQTDFCVYYTAGQSLNHGLSPYDNNVVADPALWDGKSEYANSRFLYPPLAASLFQPLASMPYATAKVVWGVFILGCFFVSLWVTMRLVGPADRNLKLLCWSAAVWAYPLLANLERGQIDLVTLMLIILAFAASLRATPRGEIGGGLLLALATLLKLHVVLIVPFLLLRRKFRLAAGYAAGGLALGVVSLGVNGVGGVSDYATKHFKRISRYGEYGTVKLDQSKLPPDIIRDGETFTIKDGREYLASVIPLKRASNGSLARSLAEAVRGKGHNVSNGTLSIVLFAAAFSGLALVAWRGMTARRAGDPASELMFWYIPITLTLLCGPFTWIMNVVWLLPLAFVVAREFERAGARRVAGWWSPAMAAAAVGLVLVVLPDPSTLPTDVWLGAALLKKKYLIAELLILAGATAFVRGAAGARPVEAAAFPVQPRPAAGRYLPGSNVDEETEEAVAI